MFLGKPDMCTQARIVAVYVWLRPEHARGTGAHACNPTKSWIGGSGNTDGKEAKSRADHGCEIMSPTSRAITLPTASPLTASISSSLRVCSKVLGNPSRMKPFLQSSPLMVSRMIPMTMSSETRLIDVTCHSRGHNDRA